MISVKDFGATGNGVTDDYTPIQTAIAKLNALGGGTLLFPKGTYFINRYRIDGGPKANGITNFTFKNLKGIIIEGDGSKIIMAGNWQRTADYTLTNGFSYSFCNNIGFSFTDCSNITIKNLIIDGGANTITRIATAEGSSYGINLEGCYQVSIENVDISYYCADGLMINGLANQKACQFVNVINSKFNNNARQGCSIVQLRHGNFALCEFSNAGYAGNYGGHLPMSGVDIEPNFYPGMPNYSIDEFTGNITFTGCLFKNNQGFQTVSSTDKTITHPVTFYACTFDNTTKIARAVVSGAQITRFHDCYFNNVSLYPDYTLKSSSRTEVHNSKFGSNLPDQMMLIAEYPDLTFLVNNCEFKMVSQTPAKSPRIYLKSPNVDFTNNRIFVNSTEHVGNGLQTICLLQNARYAANNVWNTNLTNAYFYVAYDGTRKVVNDYYAKPMFISPVIPPRNQVDFSLG